MVEARIYVSYEKRKKGDPWFGIFTLPKSKGDKNFYFKQSTVNPNYFAVMSSDNKDTQSFREAVYIEDAIHNKPDLIHDELMAHIYLTHITLEIKRLQSIRSLEKAVVVDKTPFSNVSIGKLVQDSIHITSVTE
jgi:hypothetical protein